MESHIKFGVSLYSYQDEFFRRTMTLEECIESVADMGADGIEIIPEQMIPDYQHISDEFLEKWFGWMDKYHTKPIGIDAFCDEKGLYKKQGREMPFDETVALHRNYIDVCYKLGAYFIRTMSTDEKLLRETVPYAEEMGVTLGLEVHAPGHIRDKRVQDWLNIKEKLGTKNMGLIPDFGIWETRPTPVIMEQCIRDGCSREYVELAEEKKAQGWSWEQMQDYLKDRGANPGETDGVWRVFNVSYDDPQDLRLIMPHIISIHGKFWQMKDNMQEASIDYENPLRVLLEEGYNGYICSEYEGGRHIQDVETVRGVEQVRRHHAMMHNFIEKIVREENC